MAEVDLDVRKNANGEEVPLTSTEQDAIQDAANDAENASTIALGILNTIWNQPGSGKERRDSRKAAWRNNADVVRWFGSDKLTNDEIRDTRRRLRRIQEEFDDEA